MTTEERLKEDLRVANLKVKTLTDQYWNLKRACAGEIRELRRLSAELRLDNEELRKLVHRSGSTGS